MKSRNGVVTRDAVIVSMLRQKHTGAEIARLLKISPALVSQVRNRAGLRTRRGVPKGTRYKGMDARDAKIVALDDGTRSLEELGEPWGLSKERVRQILKMKGQPPHSEVIKKRVVEDNRKRTEDIERRAQLREQARCEPTEKILEISRLHRAGLTAAEIGAHMNLQPMTIGVAISARYRKRWPHLFPYKRPYGGQPKGPAKQKPNFKPYRS